MYIIYKYVYISKMYITCIYNILAMCLVLRYYFINICLSMTVFPFLHFLYYFCLHIRSVARSRSFFFPNFHSSQKILARIVASQVHVKALIYKPGSGWVVSGKGDAKVNCNQRREPRLAPKVRLISWTYARSWEFHYTLLYYSVIPLYVNVSQWTECKEKQAKWSKEKAGKGQRMQL